MEINATLVPLLVVRNASIAIDFYARAFGAKVVALYEHGVRRHVSHADLDILGTRLALTEEARSWNSDAPPSLGGSPVVLQLFVNDAERTVSSMLAAGASVVFPLQEFIGERMARIPVGAGKSTFALRLARDEAAVRLTLDEWMATLFRPDRPDDGVVEWYRERAARSLDQIWLVAEAIVASGTSVILEVGLLGRAERERFYERVDAAGHRLVVHVLDAPRDVRRRRVIERNHSRGVTFSMVVSPEVFELASDLWEPFEDDEGAGRDVRFVGESLRGSG